MKINVIKRFTIQNVLYYSIFNNEKKIFLFDFKHFF